MTQHEIHNRWLFCDLLTRFFSDFSGWKTRLEEIEPKLSSAWKQILSNLGDEQIRQTYEDLFMGTNANIYVPLWASVCRSERGTLLDKTTLAVIREYQRWGYAHVEMDGNPPDYIGQLMRFLCYLCAAEWHCMEQDEDVSKYESEIQEFIRFAVLETVRVVTKGINENTDIPLFRHVASVMIKAFSAENFLPVVLADGAVLSENEEANLICYEISKSGAYDPIAGTGPEVVYTAGRNNCGGRCSIRTVREEGCITELGNNDDFALPEVKACARGRSYLKTYLTGKRLRYPMKRIGARGEGRFQRITWDEAADMVSNELQRLKDAYGCGTRYINYGNGVSAIMRPDTALKRLLNLDGGLLEKYNSYSTACTQFVTPYIYGDRFSGNSEESFRETKYLILWAHNPADTFFSPYRNKIFAELKEKGVPVIVIDPRKSETVVNLATEWVPIKPSTDSAMADAMGYVILSENLQDQHFMDTYCQGFDEEHMPKGVAPNQSYKSYLFGLQDGVVKTPEWAEEITGVPADTIRRIARAYATAKPACIMPGYGNQRTGNGEQTVRSIAALACLTGNVGIPGGGAAGAYFVVEEKKPAYPVGDSAYGVSIPSFLWSKAIDAPNSMTTDDGIVGADHLETGIKIMFNIASNTLLNQHSDINQTIRILKDTSKCECVVCTDVFMTPSARFADLLLPAPSFLEENNIAFPWISGHYLLYNNKVVEPLFDCKTEYYWVSEVAKRMGLWEEWSAGHDSVESWLEDLYTPVANASDELPDYSTFKAQGGHAYRRSKTYIAYEEQIKDPANHPFKTPSGKIEIYSPRLAARNRADIPAIPKYVPCAEGPSDPLILRYPLQLIGWHTKRRCHSIHESNPLLEEIDPQRVWVNVEDARKRGITNESTVEIYNDRGRIRMKAFVTDRIIAGVVALSEGAWYTPDADGVDVRGSINVLTSARATPLANGNPQHTNLVEIKLSSDVTEDNE